LNKQKFYRKDFLKSQLCPYMHSYQQL